ncbi:serine hydrolase [Terrarubrum flagellatum]|uniref:serine hydrolase n=1 Tax=Terrirubrum flagellatum TaxID=2895980 RepID=UPI003144D8EF
MRLGGVGRPVGLIAGAVAIGAGLLVATTDTAEAGRRRHHYRRHAVYNYAPPTASMVVDGKTGRILQASNPDAPRIPASITKVMTLYMLFEQLERGRYSLNSELRVSANAAAQPPTKLGLQPGDTITVEDAIKGMVTKSANDAAMVVAENISGSEDAFAEAMTGKARAIGMSRTSFYNPHGLPNDPPNITTARDLVTLGRAIQDRFPKYYHYFATRSFEFNGSIVAGHNRLLGRIEGVDGIKTGYTRASGFNLLTSARLDGRHVVGVVLGGRSGRSRDAQMAAMISSGMERAYAGARIAPPIGETAIAAAERPAEPVRVASAEPPRPPARAVVADNDTSDLRPAPATTASISPPRPVARPLDLANVRPVVASAATPPTVTPSITSAATRALTPVAPIPQAKIGRETPEPVEPKIVAAYAPVRQTASDAPRPPSDIRQAAQPAPRPVAAAAARPAALPAPIPVAAATAIPKQTSPSGWVIQLGATDDQAKANAMLAQAKTKARGALAKASPFTEKISKDGATLWRARFAGFDADEAQAACKALKRDGFACFAARG